MKKILTTVAAVLALATVSNAQLWIGGNLGVSTLSKTDKTKDDSFKQSTSLNDPSIKANFTPKVGFNFNDVMCVGIGINLETATKKTFDGTKDNKITERVVSNKVGIAPFFRYTFVEFGDFSVFGEATANFDLTSSKTKPEQGSDRKGAKIMDLGLNVKPVVAYAISDRVTLTADINIFKLGVNFQSITADPDNHKDDKSNSTRFNLGLSDNVSMLGALNIGCAIYF